MHTINIELLSAYDVISYRLMNSVHPQYYPQLNSVEILSRVWPTVFSILIIVNPSIERSNSRYINQMLKVFFLNTGTAKCQSLLDNHDTGAACCSFAVVHGAPCTCGRSSWGADSYTTAVSSIHWSCFWWGTAGLPSEWNPRVLHMFAGLRARWLLYILLNILLKVNIRNINV